jgi:hypothetical protein
MDCSTIRAPSLLVVSVLCWLVTLGYGRETHADATIPAPTGASCVSTPAQYRTAFEGCAPAPCVAPNLYGVIGEGNLEQQSTLYPPGFYWAWVTGSESLKQYADWRGQVCRGVLRAAEMTRRMLLFVGFGEANIRPAAAYTLSVMDLGHDPTLFVPTWEEWFLAFERVFHLVIPLESQKALTLEFGRHAARDPTRHFAEISGCPQSSTAQCSDQPVSACAADYIGVANALKPHSPIDGMGSTDSCVSAFRAYLSSLGRVADAAEARALLRYCQDANPCNSGVGIGFNPAYPMAGGPEIAHFTGREFVVRNRSLGEVGAVLLALEPPS